MPKRKQNIRKRSDGRWEGRIFIFTDAAAKRKYKYVYGKSHKEVQQKMQQYILESKEVPSVTASPKTVDSVAQEWLMKMKQHKKYSTYIKYLNIYNGHIKEHIGRQKVNQVDKGQCISLLQYEYNYGNAKNKSLSKSTLNAIANVLKQILRYGENNIPINEIKANIFLTLDYQYSKINIFSKEEQNRLEQFLLHDIDSCKLGIILCQFTGLRLGEICALTTENILLNERIVRVTQTVQRLKSPDGDKKTKLVVDMPKTNHSKREIPICDSLFEILKQYMPDTKYLVNGNYLMEPRTYQYKFQSYLKMLSIQDKTFHTLRHTFATNCIENGMEVKCLSELLGHASVQTTLNKYVHPSFEAKLKQMNASLSHYGRNYGQM